MKILIVDDNAENRYVLEYMLQADGYVTDTASNGIEALEKLRGEPFDAIISDILMPGMDGFRLIEECRKDPSLKKIPFIFYTATYTEKKDIDFGLSLGAVRYIIKPMEPDEFLSILNEILKNIPPGVPPLPAIPAVKETVFEKEYSNRLVAKMDKKIRELTESEEKYRSLFEHMLNGFAYCQMIYNSEGHPEDFIFIDVNPAFDQIIGIKNVTGKRITEVFPGIREAYPELFETCGRVSRTGIPESFEIEFKPIEKWLHISGYSPAKGDFIALLDDITERKRADEALHQVNKKLNLLSSITRHDILNGIAVLEGYIELAGEESLSPGMQEYIGHMEKAAKTIRHQIEFTREYQEIGVKEATWQNVRETVKAAGSPFKMENVTLTIACENIEIFADPLLQKVFHNLFDNAFRYAPPFTTITISCKETEGGLSVIFEDDGAGITEDIRKNLFERGFGNHTGLGLFLSREILAITGITITENGEPGKGARFEMTVSKSAYRFSSAGKK